MEQQMIMSADADSAEMMRCIEDCEACHRLCLHMAMNHCLEVGGEHVEPGHLRTMLVCADVCRATADAMLSSFAYHEVLCSACTRICDECAESCERVGDMDECVNACRRCAESCERMSGSAGRSEYGTAGVRALGGDAPNKATPSL
jgi:hypothetical protein